MLQQNESIKIVKADKGNCAVVIDSQEYEEKVKTHLSDSGAYEKLQVNPTQNL